MFRKSQTFKSLVRLLAQLPRRRKQALMRLIPLAILAGVADLVVVALVARLFTVVVGGENRPSIPWEGLVPEDPRVKVVVLVVAFVSAAWFSSLSKLLLQAFQLDKIHMLRRGLAGHKPIEAIQRVISLLERYPSNAQMLVDLPSKS